MRREGIEKISDQGKEAVVELVQGLIDEFTSCDVLPIVFYVILNICT